jgi:spermidine/putrescine transport system permease protein
MMPMRFYAAALYVFLYAPIALIVFFSFNAGRYAMDWQDSPSSGTGRHSAIRSPFRPSTRA